MGHQMDRRATHKKLRDETHTNKVRERERTREKNVENWSTTGTEGQTRGRPTTKNGNISMKVNYKRYTICNVLRWQIDHVGSFQKQFGCPTERKRMRWKRAVLFFAQVSATLESILRHIQSPLHPGICPRPNWFHGSGPNWFYSRWIYTYI